LNFTFYRPFLQSKGCAGIIYKPHVALRTLTNRTWFTARKV
jgi:hypothetical protein